jgi:hypothetical protein
MSKVDELRAKYPVVIAATFKKFVESDKTPTKKYLEYLLKSWINRESNQCPPTTTGLIELVKSFDELLPYIENKDIYSKDYCNIFNLRTVIYRAEETKEEKTFVREEHVLVLDETDEYIFLQPLTHRGSLRYGAQTRWCTASKNDVSTFNRYTKSGLLTYLIDKKGDKSSQYKKIAFHESFSNDVLTSGFDVYNSADSTILSESLFSNGWSEEVILKIIMIYKILFVKEKKLKKSKDFINNFSETINRLNFDSLVEHMILLEQNKKIDYTSTVQEQINILLTKLNELNYARFTETKS